MTITRANFFAPLVLTAASGVLCAGCDGIYSATFDGNGNVVVVNRLTGEARTIHGDTVVAVKPQSPTILGAKAGLQPRDPALDPLPIQDQPFMIHGKTKFRDGNLLVRVTIQPQHRPTTDAEWIRWRAHLRFVQQGTALIMLQFTDDDGFEITGGQKVPLASMTQTLGLTGDVDHLEEQLSVPMTLATYEAISGWNVTWGGFWPAYADESKKGSK